MKRITLLFLLILIVLASNAQGYNFDQGVKSFNDKDIDKALEYFNLDIKENPKNASSYNYLSIIYVLQEKYLLALSNINSSLKFMSTKDKKVLAGVYQLRADVYIKMENFVKAFDDYKTAIKLLPNDPELYMDRAQSYFILKQYDKSEKDYQEILKFDEGNVHAWAGLGRNYLYQMKYSEAEKTLTQLIKLSSDYKGGFYYRSQLYYEQKKYDEAIDDIFQCFLLDETDKEVQNLFIQYADKNYPLALSKVNAQIYSHPEKENWYFTRAQLYEGKNDFLAAIKDYTKVMGLVDIDYKFNLLFLRAKCFTNTGFYEKAISDFSEAISIDSSNAYYFGYRADVERLMGNYLTSVTDFTKAIEIEPREPWFYYKRGWTKEFLKDFDGALSDYNEAISINKNYAYSFLNRGRLYETKFKEPLKAKEDYSTVLAIDTTILDGGNCSQYAFLYLGRNNDAIERLNKEINKYPSGRNYYDAACLYSLMNKPKEAIEHLKIAFQKGYVDFTHMNVDSDLDTIRNLSEFKSLVSVWKKNFDESLKNNETIIPAEIKKESETVSIPMKSKGSGTYEITCKINDLVLNMIFDTGASDISISQTEAQFMIKNGYLSDNDVIGTQKYMDANGDIEVGTTVIFRKVDFGGMILKNVKASVVQNKNAPLLFGQSALGKYGKITIDNEKKVITITSK